MSAQRLVHTLRFYEALTALTSASTALLSGCDPTAGAPVQHADAIALVADVARAVEQCAVMLGWRADASAQEGEDLDVGAWVRKIMVMCCWVLGCLRTCVGVCSKRN